MFTTFVNKYCDACDFCDSVRHFYAAVLQTVLGVLLACLSVCLSLAVCLLTRNSETKRFRKLFPMQEKSIYVFAV